MGKEVDTDKKAANVAPDAPSAKTARSSHPVLQMQEQAGNQAVQRLVNNGPDPDAPAFDSDGQRRYGSGPLTASALMSPLLMKRDLMKKNRRSTTSAGPAIADFVKRFPFLKDLVGEYQDRIAEVLGQDQTTFKEARKVDTALNWDYLRIGGQAYSLPDSVNELRDLQHVESLAESQKRTETLPTEWIFSSTPIQLPRSPLAESDGRTYLRQEWERIRTKPVYLAIDGFAEPALTLFVSDGITDWEIKHSAEPLEMDDLLEIESIAITYDNQEKFGPKRASLEKALAQAKGALRNVQDIFDDQRETDRQAAPLVVPISKSLGKGGAIFSELVEKYEALAAAPSGLVEGPAFANLIEQYESLVIYMGGGAGDAFKGVLKQYESDVNSEMWDKKYELTHDPETHLSDDEKKDAHTQAYARALKDWTQAPDVLPDEKSFTRASEATARAAAYLEQGDMEAASLYLTLAFEVERRIANRIDRYKTRVTSGAGSAAKILTAVETGSHIILAVAAGAEFGLLGGAAVDAGYTFATKVASGESASSAAGDATKAFVTDLLFGRLSEAMSASLVLRGWSPVLAHMVANVAALPYVTAANVMFQKALDPDAPLPGLEDLSGGVLKDAAMGSLISLSAHAFGGRSAREGAGGEKGPTPPETTAPPAESKPDADWTPEERARLKEEGVIDLTEVAARRAAEKAEAAEDARILELEAELELEEEVQQSVAQASTGGGTGSRRARRVVTRTSGGSAAGSGGRTTRIGPGRTPGPVESGAPVPEKGRLAEKLRRLEPAVRKKILNLDNKSALRMAELDEPTITKLAKLDDDALAYAASLTVPTQEWLGSLTPEALRRLADARIRSPFALRKLVERIGPKTSLRKVTAAIKKAQRHEALLQRAFEADEEGDWSKISGPDRSSIGRHVGYEVEEISRIIASGGRAKTVLNYEQIDKKTIAKLMQDGGHVFITQGQLKGGDLRFDIAEIDFGSRRTVELIDLAPGAERSHVEATRAYQKELAKLLPKDFTFTTKEQHYVNSKGQVVENLEELLLDE